MRFLSLESGFGITQKWFEHHSHDSNFNVLWIGFVNTVVVSVCGILLSTLVGVVIALAMHGKNPLIKDTEIGFNNFCVIDSKINEMEWLYLASQGHRRALIKMDDNKYSTEWLTP